MNKTTINAKLFALKYKLVERLAKSLENDKSAIKGGAKLTFDKYCRIKVVDCNRSTLNKSKLVDLCNKYGVDINTLYTQTRYQRVDIDGIPSSVDNKVDEIFHSLLETSNDNYVVKLASKVNNIK